MSDLPPLISVILVNRGAGAVIQEALESVLRQTYRHVEILVIDCDPAAPLNLLQQQWCAKHERIALHQLPSGANPFNYGQSQARGAYLALITSEDLWPDQKLEWQLAALQSSGAAVALGHAQRFSTDGHGETYWGAVTRASMAPTAYLPQILRLPPEHMINMHTALISRAALADTVLVDPALAWAADWDAWLSLAARAKFVHIDRELLFCREYPRHRPSLDELLARLDAELGVIERHCPRGVAGWYLRQEVRYLRYSAALDEVIARRAQGAALKLWWRAFRRSACGWRSRGWRQLGQIVRLSRFLRDSAYDRSHGS